MPISGRSVQTDGWSFTSTAKTEGALFLNYYTRIGKCRMSDDKKDNFIMTEHRLENEIENRIVELPILPLRSLVIFPSGLSPLTVGRPLSLAASEAALATEEKLLGVLTQRGESDTDPTPELLYSVGTLVVINRMMRAPGSEEVLHLIVHGQERIRVLEFTQQTPYLKARIEVLPDPVRENTPEVEALRRT